jgi:hypothetical protein
MRSEILNFVISNVESDMDKFNARLAYVLNQSMTDELALLPLIKGIPILKSWNKDALIRHIIECNGCKTVEKINKVYIRDWTLKVDADYTKVRYYATEEEARKGSEYGGRETKTSSYPYPGLVHSSSVFSFDLSKVCDSIELDFE